jgi:hypothetical protein
MEENLMEGLLNEITRVAEMKKEYLELPKNAGVFAASLMAMDLQQAKKAIAESDTISMIQCYKKLKEYEY